MGCVPLTRAAQLDGLRSCLDSTTAALRQSLHADLSSDRSELQARLQSLRSEMAEQAHAGSQASISRAAPARRELEQLRDELKTRIEEAEKAISNGSATASALQEDVSTRRTSLDLAPHRAQRAVPQRRVLLHAVRTPSVRHQRALCTPTD